ncbi:MAG: GNAT family N-acetyltransferase [Fermentimonas sp.]|nr:GNAT family N-acetyltransferase [Fermentimonas sp.]
MEYRTIIKVQYKEYDRIILEKSWEWLNDPEIKKIMNVTDMNKEAQEEWFRSLKDRKDYFVVGVWRDEEPIGVIGIKNINGTDGEIFGYIGEKKYWGKAIGADMMQATLDNARDLGLSSVYANMRRDNALSYKLHRRFGFVKELDVDDLIIRMRYYF